MGRKQKIKIYTNNIIITWYSNNFFYIYKKENNFEEDLITSETKKILEKQLSNQETSKNDIFYNIEYSGFDLNGNRYIIVSKEALINKDSAELVNMKYVNAKFYFKNDEMVTIQSDEAIYNNKTLDIEFFGKVLGNYLNSKLFAQNANYSNSKGYISVSNDVKIIDPKGTIFAKKLLFDIKAKTLKITSNKNDKVKANINLK